jgi:hypothetical protein
MRALHGRPGRGNHVEEDHGTLPLYGLPAWRGCDSNEGKWRPHRARATAKAERTPSVASLAGSELWVPPRACFGQLHDRGRQCSVVTGEEAVWRLRTAGLSGRDSYMCSDREANRRAPHGSEILVLNKPRNLFFAWERIDRQRGKI